MDKETRSIILVVIGIFLVMIFAVSSCTVSFNMVGSQGKATDLVDTEQTNDPDPELSIPVSVI